MKAEQGTVLHMVHHMVCSTVSPVPTQGMVQPAVHQMVHLMSSRSCRTYGKDKEPYMETPFRTTTPSTPAMTTKQALVMQNVQNTSEATETGFQTRRLISLEKSPVPTQRKDFCEQTPIEEAGHSVTLFWLL